MPISVRATEEPEFELIEAGTYNAKLDELEERQDGQFGPSVRFIFKIEGDEDYDGYKISGFVTLKIDEETNEPTFWPGTKMWAWVEALNGGSIATDEEIDLEDLVGRSCRVTIIHKEDKKGRMRDKVGDVLAPRKKKKAAAKAEVESSEEDDFSEIPF